MCPRARSTQGLAPGSAKPPRNPGVTARGSVWAGAFRNRSTVTTTSTAGTPRSNTTTTTTPISLPLATAPTDTSAPVPTLPTRPTTVRTVTRLPNSNSNFTVPPLTCPPPSTMATQAAAIDPTKAAKYPIILSDALLGKASKETYTGVRYNHKPALSSDSAPATARLKQSAKDGVFNLGFEDQGDKYQYSGTRTSEDGKYVLIFDPARQAFILHRVDSLFHMNLTKTPTESNVESLRKQFPHLEVTSKNDNAAGSGTKQSKAKGTAATDKTAKATPSKATAAGGKGKASSTAKETPASKAKADKSKTEKNKAVALTLPSATASKPSTPVPAAAAPAPAQEKKPRRKRSPVDSEEDDDTDDDLGLTIEYPGGPPTSSFNTNHHFSPAFPTMQRRFSEFVRTQEDEDADAEGDFEEDDMGVAEAEDNGDEEELEFEEALFKLPSPVNKGGAAATAAAAAARPPVVEQSVPVEVPERFVFEDDDSDADANGDEEMVDVEIEGDADADADADDLDEEELLKQFHQGGDGNESDSSVSEEE